ncbi:MAG TPA: class I SAM-dependent methyltransferase [Solirubrobacteraceae bacterium]|nr:class I SAM-dependent methyltransferase [Solirubrobacteraceae bacterium]
MTVMERQDTDRSDALVDRLFHATIGALELYSVYLGAELGLYRALEAHGASTAPQLAEHAGIDARYAREWLEQQAVAGLLEAQAQDAPPDERRFALPADHARVLAHPDDEAHLAPLAHLVAGIGGVLPRLAAAYRTGEGVPYADYGPAFRHGQGHINRPAFLADLPGAWMDALPDVREHLARDGGRVADVGCGQGFASVAMAHAFPRARVHAFDADPASIRDARAFAAEREVQDRVEFVCDDAATIGDYGPFDLVLVLETLHDLARPVDVLAAIRASLAPHGAVLVVDERVADTFTAPGDDTERMMYGWSVTHCLPTARVEAPSAATGTVMRSDTLREYAAAAGLPSVEVLPVDNDLFRLYRLSA